MELLDEIQRDLVSEAASLPNTLRKAKILARHLNVTEFSDWLKHELDGYPDDSAAPDYRQTRPTNIGTFSGPFGSGAKGVVLPTIALPEPVRTFADLVVFTQGVGELEGMITHKGEALSRKWPQEYVILARDAIQMSGGMVLVDASQPIPRHFIVGILDSIKNKLLDFILELQKSGISLDATGQTSAGRETIRNLFKINVYGSHNIVASGEVVHQGVLAVKRGDAESAKGFLHSQGVSEEDIAELLPALKGEKNPPANLPGPKVAAWLGRMVGKAASGLWKVSLDVAPKIIMEMLKAYYGW